MGNFLWQKPEARAKRSAIINPVFFTWDDINFSGKNLPKNITTTGSGEVCQRILPSNLQHGFWGYFTHINKTLTFLPENIPMGRAGTGICQRILFPEGSPVRKKKWLPFRIATRLVGELTLMNDLIFLLVDNNAIDILKGKYFDTQSVL